MKSRSSHPFEITVTPTPRAIGAGDVNSEAIAALRRARTVARLHQAGVSSTTLATLLPDFREEVEALAEAADVIIVLPPDDD